MELLYHSDSDWALGVSEISIKLVKKAKDLASDVLSSGLLMVHDTSRGGENNVAELTRRQ